MAMDVRVLLFGGLVLVGLLAVALAAEHQEETFLKPSELESGFEDRKSEQVSGALVFLTGIPVALATALAASLLSPRHWYHRIAPAAAIFGSTYILVLLVQSAMFNYTAIDVSRSASFSISLLVANESASPSLYIGPLALLFGAAIGFREAGRALFAPPEAGAPPPEQNLLRFLGAVLLAAPFLIVLAIGSIRVVAGLPETETGSIAYFIALPLAALAAVGLLVTAGVKAYHLGAYARNRHLGDVAIEAWDATRRAEWVLVGVLSGLAVLASILEPVQADVLQAGRVFGITAQSHMQFQLLIVLALLPSFMLHQPTVRAIDTHSTHEGSLSLGMHRHVMGVFIALGVALVGTTVLTFATDGSLWPWMAATVPLAGFALVALRPRDGLLPGMLGAFVLWAIGNTVTGSFQLTTDAQLRFHTHPGVLSLFRALAVLLAAWAVARAARERTQDMQRTLAWPLTVGLGACVALLLFLEFPFTAWIVRDGGEYVGIGTFVASQDQAVRVVMHTVSGLCALGIAMGTARLHRPDWFRRGGPPSPVPDLPPAPAT